MIPNIPIEVIGTVAVAVIGIGLAAYRRGAFSYSDDIDGDGESETVEADFSTQHDPDYDRLGGAEGDHEGPTDDDGDAVPTDDEPSFDMSSYDGLSDIKGVGPTKAGALEDAGIITPTDVFYSTDNELQEATGIGPSVVEQIRSDIGSANE